MGYRMGMARVKIHKVRGLLNILCFFSFYLSSALVKAELEELLELTNVGR